MNSDSSRQSFFLQSVKIAGVVCLYWFISISMVFVNKYLLSSPELKLDAPLFVTWFQCVFTVACCAILGTGARIFPAYISFPEFQIDKKISREVLPLSFLFVAMITANNLCLKFVTVAFYYIGRSLVIIFSVVCTYLILKQKTSVKSCFCCGIVLAGFLLGVNQEDVAGTLSFYGVFFGVTASLFVALNAIFTKSTLPVVSDNVWRLTLYNNVNASFLFIPCMIMNGELSALYHFEHISLIKFWLAMTVGGLFGFMMGFVTGLQIQVTSPLTHNISAVAKSAFQTLLAVLIFSEFKSTLWWMSNCVVLGGSVAYTLVKRAEMRNKDAEGQTSSPLLDVVNKSKGVGSNVINTTASLLSTGNATIIDIKDHNSDDGN